MITLRLTLCLGAVLLCFAPSLFAQAPPPPMAPDYLPDKWKEYTYKDHNFRVRMPREPRITKRGDNTSSVTSYKNTSWIEFAVDVMEYGPDVDFEKQMPALLDKLQAAGLAAAAQFKPKLIKSADEKVGGLTARFFHTEAENGDVIRAKFFVTKNRIYFIYGSVKKGAPHGINHENDFEKPMMAFLNSFQLLSAE
jgi:hypothetical protein